MNTFQRATLGNFLLWKSRILPHTFSRATLQGQREEKYHPKPFPGQIPCSPRRASRGEKFLLLTTQLPFSLPFPKEAFGLLLPTLSPPWLLLNSSLVPWESKANIKRALMCSFCLWTTQHQRSLVSAIMNGYSLAHQRNGTSSSHHSKTRLSSWCCLWITFQLLHSTLLYFPTVLRPLLEALCSSKSAEQLLFQFFLLLSS